MPLNGKTPTKQLLKKVGHLNDQDQHDFFDLVKKSLFYQKSAQALVEADEAVEEMQKEVETATET